MLFYRQTVFQFYKVLVVSGRSGRYHGDYLNQTGISVLQKVFAQFIQTLERHTFVTGTSW